MTIFAVKHSALLRQAEHVIARDDVHSLIHKLTDKLIHIEDTTGEFALHLDDGRIIDAKGWAAGWEWTHGIGLYAIYHYYRQTGDKEMLSIIDRWFSEQLQRGLPTKNVNTVCPLLTLAYRYEEAKNPAWRSLLERWGEWVMYEMPRTEQGGLQHVVIHKENHQQLWDDTLMMTVMPLAKIGLLLGRPEFVEEAKYQFLLHIQYLMDRETGLWFHGWTFEGNHNFSRARWARGNSWITVAIPDFIELLQLPEQDATRRYLLQVLEHQVRTLSRLQDSSGLWHTLLDDDQSYLESSATAGFAYGILKAVRKRYIARDYAVVGQKAIRGVAANISEDGELKQASFGTEMGSDLEYYRQIPLTPMPYGQAMAILCLSEYLHDYL
ncbi:beta-galactosidase BglB [Pantoea piersonii]|uniref:beta-galactosidase BglB n=2 Tax=Pantoea piersonii TaxID=2364647 RepID=UPI0028ABC3F2|nr:glycoside hydrolase family 88 protein [Pantoea piersonii]